MKLLLPSPAKLLQMVIASSVVGKVIGLTNAGGSEKRRIL
jgi:hypothetical protein